MRNLSEMALLDSERPPKVWQPWYIDEGGDSMRKSLPSRHHREQRARERMAILRPYHRRTHSPRGAPSDDEEEIDVGDVRPLDFSLSAEDTPLDMSLKRRSPPPVPRHTPAPYIPRAHLSAMQPPPAHRPISSSPPPSYATWVTNARPSVITCAPWAAPSLPPPLPPPPPYSVAASRIRTSTWDADTGGVSPARSPEGENDLPDARRQVVQDSEPDIDEHFRRSLGTNYQQLFGDAPAEQQQHDSNDSVDDHFAKALGPAWTKLKARSEKSVPSPPSLTISRLSPPTTPTSSPPLSHLNVARYSPTPRHLRQLTAHSEAPMVVVTPIPEKRREEIPYVTVTPKLS